ncbi:MAG TPA: DUF4328 domain-containing protein [Streptomyces sp.]|nr:DUF4328 domain-containing protein [Streptomyces sp.]
MVLLGVCAAVDALSLHTGFRLRTLVRGLPYGEVAQSELERMQRMELLYGLAGIAQLIALVATCVAFLVWFYRSRLNAEYFDAGRQRMSRGWTIGGWFVPVVSLWFPKKIANDIWDTSTPAAPDGTVPERLPGGVLNSWWVMFLLAMMLGRLSSQDYERAETLGEIEGAITSGLFADGAGILAAVLAIRVVSKLTAMQHTLHEQRLGAPAADPR